MMYPNVFVYFFRLQLGVSSVDELRQILGTDVEDTQKKRGRLSNDKSDSAIKDLKDDAAPTDEIVYKDSSTFLKVFILININCVRIFIAKIFVNPTCIFKGNTIVKSTQ